MPTLRGFTAWIVANGKPLPEYLVAEEPGTNRISCWIPSDTNQAFAVYWKDLGGKVDTCAFITLDGLVVPGRFLFGGGSTHRSGVRTSKNTERPFVFQKIPEHSPDSPAASPESNPDMGTIILRIKRVKRVSNRAPNGIQDISPSHSAAPRVGDMRIGFGKEVATYEQYNYTWDVKPHDTNDKDTKRASTYVSFVFRYRPKEFLITQGIMPMSTQQPSIKKLPKCSPQPSQTKRIVSAPVTPILTAPPKVPQLLTPANSPDSHTPPSRLGIVRSLPSTMHRPQARRLHTMPHQILEQTTKTTMYMASRKPYAAQPRRTVSMNEVPYLPSATGLPGEGILRYSVVSTPASETSPDVKMEDEDDDYYDDDDEEDSPPYSPSRR